MSNQTPQTGAPAPALNAEAKDGAWTLNPANASSFAVVFFYRGYHCPICQKQLEALNKKLGAFKDVGADVVAVSMDDKERFSKSVDEWDIGDLPIAYAMDEETARNWGLYISTAISDSEPVRFSEPGLFLVRPNGELYAASIQSMPFARPPLDDVISAIKFVQEKEYPPRGKAA